MTSGNGVTVGWARKPVTHLMPVVFQPAVGQWASVGLLRDVPLRILAFHAIVLLLLHNVNKVCWWRRNPCGEHFREIHETRARQSKPIANTHVRRYQSKYERGILTDSATSQIAALQSEHIVLVAIVGEVIRFDFNRKLFHERAGVACFCVWIGVPCFLFRRHRTLWQKSFTHTHINRPNLLAERLIRFDDFGLGRSGAEQRTETQ